MVYWSRFLGLVPGSGVEPESVRFKPVPGCSYLKNCHSKGKAALNGLSSALEFDSLFSHCLRNLSVSLLMSLLTHFLWSEGGLFWTTYSAVAGRKTFRLVIMTNTTEKAWCFRPRLAWLLMEHPWGRHTHCVSCLAAPCWWNCAVQQLSIAGYCARVSMYIISFILTNFL